MRYYKMLNEKGVITALGTGNGGTEITKEEYDRILAEIKEKANLVDKAYKNEITLDSVKAEWREEISRRVEDRRKAEEFANSDEAEISDEEAMKIIMGVK